MTDKLQIVAGDLVTALTSRTAIDPVGSRLGAGGADAIDDAYVVQELMLADLESQSNPRVGRKIGLTSSAVQRQLGVDQPDFGVLLADMEVPDGGTIPSDQLIAPKVEAEVAFILGSAITDASPERVRAAVSSVVPALEIVDSRISDWAITIVDTIADNASSALYVLGQPRLPLSDVDTAAVTMETRVNGTVVSTGDGAACLDDPLNALTWVAQTALRLGRPLQAGEVILSGALGPMVALSPGDRIEAQIDGLGAVSAVVSDGSRDADTNPQTTEVGTTWPQ